ncbi:MAG: SspB family protein [Hyphomicrobiales bacterium]
MAQDLIRFDLLVQEAMRDVVRKVLVDTAANGLPGEHHFFVSFRTNAPSVGISTRLLERHPAEMTIVLQHQFWDLLVSDTHFEVSLSFGGIPENLKIPFSALSGFWDPSVDFGLKFEQIELETADNDIALVRAEPDIYRESSSQNSAYKAEEPDDESPDPVGAGDGNAKVVSLSAFRKKP